MGGHGFAGARRAHHQYGHAAPVGIAAVQPPLVVHPMAVAHVGAHVQQGLALGLGQFQIVQRELCLHPADGALGRPGQKHTARLGDGPGRALPGRKMCQPPGRGPDLPGVQPVAGTRVGAVHRVPQAVLFRVALPQSDALHPGEGRQFQPLHKAPVRQAGDQLQTRLAAQHHRQGQLRQRGQRPQALQKRFQRPGRLLGAGRRQPRQAERRAVQHRFPPQKGRQTAHVGPVLAQPGARVRREQGPVRGPGGVGGQQPPSPALGPGDLHGAARFQNPGQRFQRRFPGVQLLQWVPRAHKAHTCVLQALVGPVVGAQPADQPLVCQAHPPEKGQRAVGRVQHQFQPVPGVLHPAVGDRLGVKGGGGVQSGVLGSHGAVRRQSGGQGQQHHVPPHVAAEIQ